AAITLLCSIRKPHMIELDPARSIGLLCDRRLLNLRRSVQQLKNSLRRCHRRLQNVVLLAQILNWTEEPLRVLHERHQHTNCCRIAHHMKCKKSLGTKADRHPTDDPSAQNVPATKPDHRRDRY